MKPKCVMAIWIFGNFIVYQASMAYFTKAGHTYGIYKKYVLVNLEHIEDKTLLVAYHTQSVYKIISPGYDDFEFEMITMYFSSHCL